MPLPSRPALPLAGDALSPPFLSLSSTPRPPQIVDVLHPGAKPVSKKTLRDLIAKLHKVDAKLVVVYGFDTAFGGGRSTGFGLIYDSLEEMKAAEPRHRLLRLELATKKTRSRKQWKELKKKRRVTWGTGRREAARMAKKAAAA